MPWNKYAAEAFDDDDFDRNAEYRGEGYALHQQPRCKRCGSTDVRWRQQGGRWVLFSMQPGVEHRCDAESLADDFEVQR